MNSKQKSGIALTKSTAIEILRNNLNTQQEWIKVHAAEFLLWSENPEGVKDVFILEDQLYGENPPYRIGIWRVLAQAEMIIENKNEWINKIKEAFEDENGKDRVHAIESLAKLKISPFDKNTQIKDLIENDTVDLFSIYKIWSFSHSSKENLRIAQKYLLDISVSKEYASNIRAAALYSIGKIGELETELWIDLVDFAMLDSTNIKSNLLKTVILTASVENINTLPYNKAFDELIQINIENSNYNTKMSLLDALSKSADERYLDIIYTIFEETKEFSDSESIDLLSSCAYTILTYNQLN